MSKVTRTSLLAGLAAGAAAALALAPPMNAQVQSPQLFDTAGSCIACHTGLITPRGEDVSFGSQWRGSMMANSARDPYWQAAVRREVIEHPSAQALIEDECSACHMPMARYSSKVAGHEGQVFAHLPVRNAASPAATLAADGVSCSACHQITSKGLGNRSSFTGGFDVDAATPLGRRTVYGPFVVDGGRAHTMQSASGYAPAQGTHQSSSEMCASCHTLITQAFGPDGKVVGELPEQVPYLEWDHSAYRTTRSCQSCHMPEVEEPMPVTRVLGQPRPNVSRHGFRGGNSFMIRLLNGARDDLGVTALPLELDAAARRNDEHLASETAQVSIHSVVPAGGRLLFDVDVRNLAGHKLPTAYPSRRAWLHVSVRDGRGQPVFESGAVEPSGRITGNDNDNDAARFEPHHTEITTSDQVQIYESVMADSGGAVTTGLLSAVKYVKDNRLLPNGFDKETAPPDVAVHGAALADPDFLASGDRIRYSVPASGEGPLRVEVELLYQTIGFRWAENLRRFDAPEPKRFVALYEQASRSSAVLLARETKVVERAAGGN
jgi:mono/diheme cytochrome c family protein